MKGLLFTYVMTYGGATASLFNPFYGLLIYVSFSILRPEFLWRWSVGPGNYSRTVAIALLVGWALHGFGNWKFHRAKIIVFAIVAYLAWQVLSALQATNQVVAWNQVELQAKIILPFLVGLTLIETVTDLKMLSWTIVLSMGFVAYEANMSYWTGYNWLRFEGFGSMDNNSISIGMVTVAALAFFLGVAEDVWWRRWTAFAAAGLMANAPLLADSRGGMLGLLVVGILSFFLIPKQPRYYAYFALAVLIAIRLAGLEVVERFSTTLASAEERDASAQSRVDIWRDSWDVMQKHPIVGLGPDHWPLAAPSYGWPGPKECHSLWFNAGAELGFPGVCFLLLFYLGAIWRGWGLSRREWDDPWLAAVGRMVVAAIVGFIVSATFVSLDNLEPPYYVVLIGAGALKLAPTRALTRTSGLTAEGTREVPVLVGY